MTGPAGQPTHAVFGIFRDLLNLLRDRKPDYLAAAFDGAGPVFRTELFADYKAQRAAMPDDLVPQIPVIRRVFEGFRVPVVMHRGVEADDVIATLARRGEERGLDVFICTADKDARQLHRRPYPDRQPPEAEGARRRRAAGRLGRHPRPGRRPAGADRRHLRQRARRPRHRPEDRRQAARGVRRPRHPAGQRREGLRRKAQGEPPRTRRDGPAGAGGSSPSATISTWNSTGRHSGRPAPTSRH